MDHSGTSPHFFGSQMGEDHDLLEALQDRYLEDETRPQPSSTSTNRCR